MVDLPLADDWRFVGGVRVESSKQNVLTFDPFNAARPPIESSLDNTDVLPGLNIIYRLNDGMNLRGGYSQTVNRPEFRELAPFEFTDVVGGRAVVGNPDLRRALIRNADVRWEWFPSGSEVIAASFFYKDFEDPIERVVEATAQLRTSFQNALGAVNKGLELEARKNIGQWFFSAANYTFVDSAIELERGTAQVQTSLDRPLAGQSKNVFNGIFEFHIPEGKAISSGGVIPAEGYFLGGLSVRLLYNFNGDRITDVGSLGLPDIIEEGRGRFDLVAVWRYNSLVFRFSADNLNDPEHLYTQGGELQRSFKFGRTFTFSLGYAVF
jgi:outer membrane receptor protein involved in Fe transport